MKTAYPPGPKGLPLLGSVLDLRKDKLEFLTSIAKTYGGTVDVTDVYTTDGAEFVKFQSPQGLVEIRLDHIISMRQ